MKNIKFNGFFLILFSFFLSSSVISDITKDQEALLKTLPPDQQANIRNKIEETNENNKEIEKVFEDLQTVIDRPEKEKKEESDQENKNLIYGYEIFSGSPTTFAQSTNIPIPADYILGPGDEIVFQFYGSKTEKENRVVSRSGDLVIPFIGPINVNGMSLVEAKEQIKAEVSNGIIGAEVYIRLGNVKSIQVYVLGEAYKPGAYTVSSLATVSNVLYVSGGVSEIGSLRNIEIKRSGKTVRTFDLYDLLLNGNTEKDLPLRPGDAIFIPVISKTARADGFKRSDLFEIKDDETVEDLVKFAGGVETKSKGYVSFELDRLNEKTLKRERVIFSELNKLSDMVLQDGDVVLTQKIGTSSAIGSIELRGEFKYPGVYSIYPGERISSVIDRAGGLTKEAYPYASVFTRKELKDKQKDSFERAANDIEMSLATALTSPNSSLNLTGDALRPISDLIYRLRNLEPAGRMVVDFSPLAISEDPLKDLLLKDEDFLYVPGRPSDITVSGEVMFPNSISYEEGENLDFYIRSSGGYSPSASQSKIFVIYPDGRAAIATSSLWGKARLNMEPGTTIVVPRNPRNFDALGLTVELAPILSSVATSIAALSVISDD